MDGFFILGPKTIYEGLLLSAPLVAFGIFFASVFAVPPRSAALIAISGIAAVCLSGALYLRYRASQSVKSSQRGQHELTYHGLHKILSALLRPSFIDITLLHSSAIVLFIILAIRLDSTDQFGGHIANLDFGEKSGGDGENIAFTASATTVGHCVQGVLASFFSYPAVAGLIARIASSEEGNESKLFNTPSVYILSLCKMTSVCMSFYPSYSLMKRLIKDSETFSRTSHMNNTTEWVLGYVLGVGFGWLATALVERSFLTHAGLKSGDETNDETKLLPVLDKIRVSASGNGGDATFGFGRLEEYDSSALSRTVTSAICIVLLCMLSISSLLTGVFIGLTWSIDKKESSADAEIAVAFAAIHVIITVSMGWFASRKWPFNYD